MILAAAVFATVVLVPVVAFAFAPHAPSDLSAGAGASEPVVARLMWKASTSPETVGYAVSVSTDADGPFKVVGSTETTGYDFTAGLGGVAYYFRVAAVDNVGEQSAPVQSASSVTAAWVSNPHAPATRTTNKCASCHVPHSAQASPLMRTEISTSTPGQIATCMTCHDGKIALAGNVASGAKDSFALASGHTLDTSASAGGLTSSCASCHDPHASAAKKPMLPESEINGNAVASSGTPWCLSCHDDSSNSWYPAYPLTVQRDAAGYPVLGTWLGTTAYTGASNAHRLIPETTQTVGPLQTVRRGAGDCLYCHAAHRGTNAYDGLVGTFRPTTSATLAADKAQGDYAAVCFTCHGGVAPSGFATAPVDIKEFVTSGGTTSGHSIVTSGGLLPVGAPLPCYECHNPHGSKRGNDSMLSDDLGGSLTTTGSASAVRQFCFTCHTTASNAKGWNSATATYTAVAAGDKVVGIPRIGGGAVDGVLDLPVLSGHGQNDTASCYSCHGADYAQLSGNNVHNPNPGGFDAALHTAAPLAEFVVISELSYGPVACADCHDLTLGAEHEKATSSSAGVGCATCHPTPKDTLTPSWDKSCAQGGCHTPASSAPMHVNIDTSHAPVAGQTCYPVGCHPATGTESLAETHLLASAVLGGQTRTGCQVCHWNGVPASGQCASCHADRVDGTHGASTAHAFTPGSDAVANGDAGCTNSGPGCHGADETRVSFASYHPDNGCTAGACHTSGSNAGYLGNGDCQSCHDASYEGAPARAELSTQHYNEATHTATGLSTMVSAGGSASATCATCHDPNPAVGPKGLAAQHTDITPVLGSPYGTTVACVECHNDLRAGGNAAVIGGWTNDACADCHSLASSAPRHGVTAPVVATTSTESCGASGTNCHTTYDVHALHKDAAGGCTISGCHDATLQAAKPTLQTCGQAGGCHATYTSTTHAHAADSARHAPTNAAQASATFAGTACDACHIVASVEGGLDAEHALSTSAKTINAANVCLNCHNNTASSATITGNWAAKDTTTACASCHTAGLAIHATVDATKHTTASSAGCASTGVGCHNTAVLSAVGADKTANIHDTCLRCHDRTATAPNMSFDPAKDSCASCHAAGSYNGATSVHNGTGGAADGTDTMHHTADLAPAGYAGVYAGGQACSTCHSAALKTAHTASSVGSVTCAGCHNDTSLGSAAQVKASWTNDRCTDCHTASGVHTAYQTAGVTAATHKATSTAGGCSASGVGCHTSDDMATLHANTPAGCQTCHAADKDMSAVSKTCGQATGCHVTNSFHVGISGNDATHTATAMNTLVDDGNGYSGNACSDCHAATLTTAHDKTGPTINLGWTNECTDCHNSTAPIDGSAVVASNWTPKVCATCHTTSHDAYAVGHTGQPSGTNTCSGCHTNDSLDLRVVHKNAITVASPLDTGCGIAGCHSVTGASPVSTTCGTTGACHTDKIDGNHGAATSHNFSNASDYATATVSGCTNSGDGCHGTETALFSNFTNYHPDSGCELGVCHTSSSKIVYAGNHECVSCHNGNYAGATDVVGLTDASPSGHYDEPTHTPAGMNTSLSAGGTQSATCNDCHNATSATTVDQLFAQHQGIGAASTPSVLTTTFADNFETGNLASWTTADYVAPSGGTTTMLTEGFESGNFTTNAWPTTRTGLTAAPRVSTGNVHGGTYKAEQYATNTTRRTGCFMKSFNTSGYTSASVSFWFTNVAFAGGTDYARVQVSTNGTTWADLMPQETTTIAWNQRTYSLPIGATVWVSFDGSVNRTAEFVRYDDITVSGTNPTVTEKGWKAQNSTVHAGAFAAQAMGGDATTRYVTKTDLVNTGVDQVQLNYSINYASLEAADSLAVETYNGTTWSTAKTYTLTGGSLAWTDEQITGLPTTTTGVRFAFRGDTADDLVYVDDVVMKKVVNGTSTAGASLSCTECHNANAKTISLASNAVAWNDQCSACHNSTDMPAFSANHLTSVPAVAASSTQGCATTGAGCHATSDLHSIHKGNGGAADPLCSDCHDFGVQAAKPVGTTCGVGGTCHNAETYTATDHAKTGDDALHTATAMTTTLDGTTYNTGGGNTCSSCHSSGLKSAHTGVTDILDSPHVGWTTPYCENCHNSVYAEARAVTTIKTDRWSAQTCDQCHVTNGNGKHTTYTPVAHTATTGANTCTGAGCHATLDVRTLHNKVNVGCTLAGTDSFGVGGACHALNKQMTTGLTCGTGTTGCHTSHAAGNHGPDHNAAQTLGTVVGSTVATYGYGANVGCFMAGANTGCHFQDLRREHGSTAYLSAQGVAGTERTMNGARGGSADGCTVCHATGMGTAGAYAARTAITTAITNGDYRCTSCHFEASDTAGTTGVQAPHKSTEKVAVAPLGTTAEWAAAAIAQGGGHNSFGVSFPKTGLRAYGTPINNVAMTGTFGNLAGTWVSGWSQASPVTCTSVGCHNRATAPNGPQGASVPWYWNNGAAVTGTISAHWYTATVSGTTVPTTTGCQNCHATLSSAVHFGSHNVSCDSCHIRIPHAWKRPRLLRRNIAAGGTSTEPVDALPYSDPAKVGLEGYRVTATQSNFSSSGSCNDNCANTQHNSAGPYWP